MNGCCLLSLLLFLSPRIILVIGGIFGGWYWRAFDSVLLAILGWIFLPWTSLAYIFARLHNPSGEVEGMYLVLVVVAVLVDLGAFGSSAEGRRRRLIHIEHK